MDTKFKFDEVKSKLLEARRELMILLSNQAQNYFAKSFKDQGWDGVPWKNVKRRIEGEKTYKYPKKKGLQRRTSPILVGAGFKIRGGTLRRAVKDMAKTAEISQGRLRMVVDLNYAAFNNEGTKNIPQRRFIGQTQTLTDMQKKKIEQVITKIFKV